MLINTGIYIVIFSSIFEYLSIFFLNLKISSYFSFFLTVFSTFVFGYISSSTVLYLLFIFFSIYRLLNLLRGIRNYSTNLKKMILNSSLRLNLVLLLILLLDYNNLSTILLSKISFQIVSVAIFAILFYFNFQTKYNIEKSEHLHKPINYYDRDLPTLSILIPARNETNDLEKCIESILLSDYPKLEVIVLDDCSLTKQTSEIIKNYAHNGVRFIQGEIPPEDWLPKNYAYEQLLDQSNGELILFCGVDVRFESHTIRSLVDIFKTEKYSMMSVIPSNNYNKADFGSLIYQPLRYAFEVIFSRYLIKKPPVLSTCWMIEKDLINKLGTFKAVKQKVTPESYFSKESLKRKLKYVLIKSNNTIGLSSFKNSFEQKLTAIRTYYPKLHRRIDLVSLVSLSELIVFIIPFFLIVYFSINLNITMLSINIFTVLFEFILYNQLIKLTFDKMIIRYRLLVIVAVLVDIYLYNLSMLLYEFKEVYWKERNICLPVMNYKSNPVKNSD